MLKMEYNEVVIMLSIIESAKFEGKDVPVMAEIIKKLQVETTKLAEKQGK